MKKLFILFSAIILTLCSLTACGKRSENHIVVGATSTPHAEILQFIKEDYEKLGYKLDIIIYSDYIMPNVSLAMGDLDANYFQHLPYLQQYNSQRQTSLISACAVHYEPMGIFAKGVNSLSEIPQNALIIIPADQSNQARALLLLAENNIITLAPNASIAEITVLDVLDDKGHILRPVEAASIPAQLNQGDNGTVGVINGNYALASGISLNTALAVENNDSQAALTYANILAVQQGAEKRQAIIDLVNLLTSEKVKNYISANYQGAVLPI